MRVINQVEKTLWTCAVESAFEFHRIVDEIYPDGVRLMRFVISDFVGRFLTPDWGTQLISQDQVHFHREDIDQEIRDAEHRDAEKIFNIKNKNSTLQMLFYVVNA